MILSKSYFILGVKAKGEKREDRTGGGKESGRNSTARSRKPLPQKYPLLRQTNTFRFFGESLRDKSKGKKRRRSLTIRSVFIIRIYLLVKANSLTKIEGKGKKLRSFQVQWALRGRKRSAGGHFCMSAPGIQSLRMSKHGKKGEKKSIKSCEKGRCGGTWGTLGLPESSCRSN